VEYEFHGKMYATRFADNEVAELPHASAMLIDGNDTGPENPDAPLRVVWAFYGLMADVSAPFRDSFKQDDNCFSFTAAGSVEEALLGGDSPANFWGEGEKPVHTLAVSYLHGSANELLPLGPRLNFTSFASTGAEFESRIFELCGSDSCKFFCDQVVTTRRLYHSYLSCFLFISFFTGGQRRFMSRSRPENFFCARRALFQSLIWIRWSVFRGRLSIL
jgi:hypothetical protein